MNARHVNRRGVANAVARQRVCREQLVVRREQGECRVHDHRSGPLGPSEASESRLDAVERREDVEAADDHVAVTRVHYRRRRSDHGAVAAAAQRSGEQLVRPRRRSCQDDSPRREDAAAPRHGQWSTNGALDAARAVREPSKRRPQRGVESHQAHEAQSISPS
jgi:hypothetical protein